jgi:very-short-patch-repair endonuclease
MNNDSSNPRITSSSEQWRKLKPSARELRANATPAEDALWQRLRGRQLDNCKFRRQHSVAGFVVDFICVEKNLVIEVDGNIHLDPVQKEYDEQRQSIIEHLGFRVLRFTNEQVLNEMGEVLKVISSTLNSRPHPNPSPEERGF